MLSETYSKHVGSTFAELKANIPDIRYFEYQYKSEKLLYSGDAYAVSKDDKVFYIGRAHQSAYYLIPEPYRNDFAKIRNLHVLGLYGIIGELFPVVDRSLSTEVFGKLLGVEVQYDGEWSGKIRYVFEYEGYLGYFSLERDSISISLDTKVELIYNSFSSEFFEKEKREIESLWLEVDPEGAGGFYEREKVRNEKNK